LKYPFSRILSVLAAPVYTLKNTLILFVPHTLSRTHTCAHSHAHLLFVRPSYCTQEIEEKFASLSDELSAKLKEQTQRTRQAEQEIRDLTREFQACDAQMASSLLAKRTIIHQPSKPMAKYFQKSLSISAAHTQQRLRVEYQQIIFANVLKEKL
jgi:hypothetical protein